MALWGTGGGRGGAATPTCEASEPQRASASQMCSSRHIPVLRVDSVPELARFCTERGAGRLGATGALSPRSSRPLWHGGVPPGRHTSVWPTPAEDLALRTVKI